jgi:hypothetical protein
MTSIKFLSLLVLATGLAACTKPVEVVSPPAVVAVPGPTGATGATGETGKTGDSSTVIVMPTPAASATSN